MAEHDTELLKRLVVGRKRDGRNYYDPKAKRELIEAAMRPGVSVAGIALRHGINANLLRNWIRLQQRQRGAGTAGVALPAFIPVVAARPTAKAAAGLVARLPNGVRLELSPVAADDLAAILHQLWALPCSGSTPD